MISKIFEKYVINFEKEIEISNFGDKDRILYDLILLSIDELINSDNDISFIISVTKREYNPNISSTKCKIYDSKWILNKDMVTFSVVSNRFLHHMIRYLVGTMIAVSEDRFSKKKFNFLLENPKKNVRIFKAPPQGLILKKIDYE